MFTGERHETDLVRFDLGYLARRKKDAKIYMLLDFHQRNWPISMLVRWVSLMHFRAPEAQEILVGKRVSDTWTNVKLAIN